MPISPSIKPLVADDDTIRAALDDAHLSSLLATIAQITGDLSLIDDRFRPARGRSRERDGGLSSDDAATARECALDALRRFRDHGCVLAPVPADDQLHRLLEFAVGDEVSSEHLPLVTAELAITSDDPGAPDWHRDQLSPDSDFRVAIIGAGMSGIVAAHRLAQAGIPFVVIEKNDDVGGTWFENTYPGCRVDVPNHAYSYSFAQRHDWPEYFSRQHVLIDYFRDCAERFGVREHVRFGTEVLAAVFDDDTCTWEVQIRARDGHEEKLVVNAVISGVGQLNRPKLPDISGREQFAGPAFHTAQWDHTVDLRGKRVAIIGTGASGIQVIPTIAPEVGELLVFQRTPNWFMPAPEYHEPLPQGLRWLFEHIPHYCQWYRVVIFWYTAEGGYQAAKVDPEWLAQGRVSSPLNDALRELLTNYLTDQFADFPELLDAVMPTYPPLAKRPLVDDGSWAGALTRDNVSLITDKITEITPTGVITSDGLEHTVDVIVYATGFDASHFLTPMRVKGRGGLDLHEHWNGDPRAYLGITLPGFPNFFCLYGPNTNIVANGSIIFFSEAGVHYILGCLRLVLAGGARALDCRAEVHDAYNQRIDEGNQLMVWGAAEVNSWYKNERGRITQCWPFSLLEYWQLTRKPVPDHYELLSTRHRDERTST